MRWYDRPLNPNRVSIETAFIEPLSEPGFSLHVDWSSPITPLAHAAEPAYVYNVLGWRDVGLNMGGAEKAGSQNSDAQPVTFGAGPSSTRDMLLNGSEAMVLPSGFEHRGGVPDLRLSDWAEFDFSPILSDGRLELFVGGEVGQGDRSLGMNADVGVLPLDFGANGLALTNNPFDAAALPNTEGPNFLLADALPPLSDMLIPNIEWGG
jgi:hypothetical protein